MKPNYRNFLRLHFPALIVIPAMIHTAHAGVINPDIPTGNITVPGNFDEVNGTAFTAQANSVVPGAKTVTIANGAILTGDPGVGNQDAVRITQPGYSVTNAGTISGNLHGISAGGFTTSVANSGTIRGVTLEGILANGGGTISNSAGATIQGLTAGVRFQTANGIVNNAGIITGQTGINSTALTSSISNSGTITGSTADAILTGGGSTVGNTNQITGATNGVRFDSAGGTLTNSGTITGTSASGVNAVSGLNLTNNGIILGITGVTVTGGSSIIANNYYIGASPVTGNAINLGATAGVGGNAITLSSGGTVEGNVVAAGTGNSITANEGYVFGNISGIQNINVAANGSLQVNGNIAATSAINAAAGSSLSGSGLWISNVTLASGAEIMAVYRNEFEGDSGVLAFTGNVTHAAGSYIGVGINPGLPVNNNGTNSPVLQSSAGTYNAANATIDVFATSNDAIRNGQYDLVQDTGGTVIGGANTITYFGYTDSVLGKYFASTSLNAAGNLVLGVTHNFAALPGLTDNQSSLGGALDTFMRNETGLAAYTSNDPFVRNLIGDLDINDLAYSQTILNAIVSPIESALGLTESIVNSDYRVHRQIQNHLSEARKDSAETTTTRSVGGGTTTTDSKGGTVTSGGETITEVSGGGSGNLWGSYSGDQQDFDGFGDNGDFDGDVNAFTIGVDYRVAPNLIIGILADGSKAELDTALGSPEIESIRGALYGTWGDSFGAYSDFLVGYGSHDLDFTDAKSLQALLTVGYAMGNEHVKHGPFIGAEYQKVEVDGFSYNLVAPIDVDDYSVKSFRGLIGYRVDADLGRFKPYASVAYAHEFEDGASDAKAFIANTPFHVKSSDRSSAVLVAAGFGIGITDSLNLDLGYRGEFSIDDEGLDSNGGTVGLNYKF